MNNKRLETVDAIRGFTIISMILYHLCWDLKYISGFSMSWYETYYSFVWQQTICYSFILIAGFSMFFARKPMRDGIILFVLGAIITAVTFVAIPDTPILFGVLTMYGSCKILVGAFMRNGAKEITKKFKRFFVVGFVVSLLLFIVTRPINESYLNLIFKKIYLPLGWYEVSSPSDLVGSLLTYLGIMQRGFFSSDYFSVVPWIFLFLVGFFFYGVVKDQFGKKIFHINIKPVNFLGRHSLLIYFLHQAVLYVAATIIGYLR
ncbi:heparan-alpha-glucosaminide N-acetyltransferase domain-containing protein [Butyrivibrio proteoclasticus]|uniref:heparan-alpha-glucosaminide N-acetyltransferase domain-containing protein n=1 Tax=Butyrivibrio proteoclasticus TaxID=43305 RepID=UPI00047919D8|nr:heparan-alpha-glucosaminide N-acetyltransferase domain-containing protein [Butyrivibrio proteoclasticus]